MRVGLVTIFLLIGIQSAVAQKQLVSTVDYEDALEYYRPRIALAKNGSYAISWETLRKLEDTEEWQVGLQRFSAGGSPIDDSQYLAQSTYCNQQENVQVLGQLDVFEGGLRNVEMDFSNDGLLAVSMEQFRLFREAAGESPRQMSRVQVNALNQHGEDVKPVSEQACEWRTFNTMDADLSAMPRIDLNKSEDLWLGTDGRQINVMPTLNISQDFRKREVSRNDADRVLKYRPAVTMNVSGQSLVVWVDYRESEDGDIFGQQFDTLGQPTGDNFKISVGNGIIDLEEGSRPEVAMLDDGHFLVVWTEHNQEGMRAWGRYYESTGQAKAEPFLLDPDPSFDSGFPDVTSNGDRFAYTWLVDDENVTSIFANVPGITNTVDRPIPINDPSLSLKGYPNPFTLETTLEYSLTESGHVTLVIFDLLGRKVKKLIDQLQGSGSYSVRLQAGELAPGYYITRLQQGDLRKSQLLVRTE